MKKASVRSGLFRPLNEIYSNLSAETSLYYLFETVRSFCQLRSLSLPDLRVELSHVRFFDLVQLVFNFSELCSLLMLSKFIKA